MHIVEMIEGDHRRFQQRRTRYPVREVALRKLLRGDEQVIERAELIDRAAWQRLRLNTHRADHFPTTQALTGAGFIFNLQIEANRGVG